MAVSNSMSRSIGFLPIVSQFDYNTQAAVLFIVSYTITCFIFLSVAILRRSFFPCMITEPLIIEESTNMKNFKEHTVADMHGLPIY